MVVSSVLLPKLGARRLVTTGMVFGAVGMFYLSRLTPASGYTAHILPSLILIGIGFALVLSPAMNIATLGVPHSDTGVASGMVNTMQQIGGSIGTALLSTIAASATTTYLTSHPAPDAHLAATVHGYATVYLVGAIVFLAGAGLAAALFPRAVPQDDHSQ